MDNNFPLALKEGTILNGEYIIKKVLGQGGFGITYVAEVHKSDELVAIKEYLPDTMASRTDSMVTPYTGERGANFNYGKQCFLEEAKTLANFIGNPGIVSVKKYFEENGTAYFVMEYVQGKSYKTYLEEKGGKIPIDEALNILVPVMDALASVHATGIIHRDVTPDNIYITDSGQVKLLDFGAARYSLGDKSRSLDVVLKHGYAPKEQYTRHGRQGPYTDVYSLAVTLYRSITGRLIQDSIDRLEEDEMMIPSALGARITESQENALVKALAVDYKDRYQTMGQFKAAILGEDYKPGNTAPGGKEIVFTGVTQAPAASQDQAQEKTAPIQETESIQKTTAPEQKTAAPEQASGKTESISAKLNDGNRKLIIWIAAGVAALALIGILIGVAAYSHMNKKAAGLSTNSLPVPEGTPEEPPEEDPTPTEAPGTGLPGTITEGTDISLGGLDLSKLSGTGEYDIQEMSISFSCSTKLTTEVDDNFLDIKYTDPKDNVQRSIFIFKMGQCGEVDSYPDTLYDLADQTNINMRYTSDLVPLTVGNYPGWLVRYSYTANGEDRDGGVIFILTPYVGVNREMIMVMGTYTEVIDEIFQTIEIAGANKENLSNVNSDNTYPLKHDTGKSSNSGYIFGDSSVRLLTQDDIDDLYKRVTDAFGADDVRHGMAMCLCYARNEIFARNGRKFTSSELQEYFNGRDWYEPKYEPKDFDYPNLTDIEKKNVDYLKKLEDSYGGYTPAK